MKLLIAELEAEIAREGKARDVAVRGKADELDKLQTSLKAKSQQVVEMAREIETIKLNANASIKSVSEELKRNDELVLELNAQLDKEMVLREQAVKDKASSEQKLLAKIEQIRGNIVSAKDEELKKMNVELSRQTSRADQLAQNLDKIAADAQREQQVPPHLDAPQVRSMVDPHRHHAVAGDRHGGKEPEARRKQCGEERVARLGTSGQDMGEGGQHSHQPGKEEDYVGCHGSRLPIRM